MLSNRKKFIFIGNQSCIDFVNTEIVDEGRKVDLIDGFNEFLAWLVAAKIMTLAAAERIANEWSGAQAARALEQAKDFRATMRAMVDQIALGKTVPQAAVVRINQLLTAGSSHSQVVKQRDGFEKTIEWDFAGPTGLIARLAESAADFICNCDPALVKRCKNPSCILYFYDTTKNHQRSWCSMDVCGNRMKVAAFYRRSISRPGGPKEV